MNRSMLSTAVTVDIAAITRWPISAACSTALAAVGVGELAEHDHVGILTERVLEPRHRRRRVGAHLALVDDRALVGVEHLDRVLDRDDVTLAVLVHVVDHGRDGGGLPRAGETGHEHEPVLLLRERRHRSGRPSASKLGMPGSTRRSTRPT